MESSDSDSDDDCTSAAAASLGNVEAFAPELSPLQDLPPAAEAEAAAPATDLGSSDLGSSFDFNPNASSFNFNPNASTFVFAMPAPAPVAAAPADLTIRRLPSVSEDRPEFQQPDISPPPVAEAADDWQEDPAQPQDENGWSEQANWQEQPEWQQQGEWQENGEGEWQKPDEDEGGDWDDDWNEGGGYGQQQQYGFEDYIDPATGDYWLDGQQPKGMLKTNWDRGAHDKSHWHPSGTASASTSPYTQATLQGATLQPWSGTLFLPKGDKPGDVQKYDTNFLLQFQNSCTKKPEELPSYLLNSGAANATKRDYNTPFKSKHRAAGSDRSTLMLDGMAQRSDLFNQQDLHVPRAPRPEGPVKQYDTNFLLKFQNMSNLKELPGFELPDLPFVIGGNKSSNNGTPIPSLPSLITPGGRFTGVPVGGQLSGRGDNKSAKKTGPRGGGKGSRGKGSMHRNSSFTDHPEQRSVGQHLKCQGSPWAKPPLLTGPVEPLNESANRWMRANKESEDETQRLHKQVLAVLNKLTPEKFERLLAKMLEIKMDTKASMTLVIGTIFDKAVGEPAYAEMYAELCRRLSESTPQVEQHGEIHTFKRMMLKKCYDNFMNEAEEEEPDQMAGEQQEEADERFNAAKKRMFGNVTLIGELFKKGLLTLNIIKICITLLLEESIEEPDCRDIEALCLLLSSVGQQLTEYIISITPMITELSVDARLPSRMRFMLQGVLELQTNQWQPRLEKTVTPKKLAEVAQGLRRANSHGHPANSPHTKTLRRQHSTPSRPNFRDQQGGGMNSRMMTPGSNQRTPVRGMHVAATPPSNPLQRSQSDGNVSLSSPVFDPSLLQSLKIRRKSSREILNTVHDMEEGHDMGRDRGFSSWEAPPAGFLESLPAEIRLEKKRPAGVGKPSVTFSSNPSQVPPVAATVPSPVTQLSPETAAAIDSALFEKKVTSAIDEYLASSDEVEAALCIHELQANDELLSTIPVIAVMHVCEKKEKDRTKINTLLKHLFTSKTLTPTHLAGGMNQLFESIPDMEMDVPMYGHYVASALAQLLAAKAVKPMMVKDIIGDMMGTAHAPKVFVAVIGYLVKAADLDTAKQAYIEMGVNGFDLQPGDAVWGEEEIQALVDSAKCDSDLMWLFAF